MRKVAVIGAGLAGCEAAGQLAAGGIATVVFEMKPVRFSPAHKSPDFAELVCSNSFRSMEPDSAIGILKQELLSLGSLVMEAAHHTRVPAGKALAVDRERFAAFITARLKSIEHIRVENEEIPSLQDDKLKGFDAVIIAAGPLASDALAASLAEVTGEEKLYFYDAIAPIITAESIDYGKVFRASRYSDGEGDYLNCPLNEDEYMQFRRALLDAEKVPYKDFEKGIHFEGCLPIEVMAERGEMTMAFGPMKPVGLVCPRTGREPFAVVQLRAENPEKTMYNMVGFQTKLTYPEQKKILRMIPGLENAEFVRMGSVHRNTFVNSPQVLTGDMELRKLPGTYLAGQITGVEGYLESAACGLWVGLSLRAKLAGVSLPLPPEESMLGALLRHLRTPVKDFQPMNAAFGLTPPLNMRAGKAKRKLLYAERARKVWADWLEIVGRSCSLQPVSEMSRV